MSDAIRQTVPKGFRLHIGIFGRRNVGKSSLLNTLTRQQSSIVSDQAGTTTDPVEKPMELLPVGPVLFIDTGGIDDTGTLGELRIKKTKDVFDRTEIGLIVSAENHEGGALTDYEKAIIAELQKRNVPVLFVFNKTDLSVPKAQTLEYLREHKIPFIAVTSVVLTSVAATSAHGSEGAARSALIGALIKIVPEDFLTPPPILSDLVPEGAMTVLVVPVDKEAPKGRLILPQVQAIRDILDAHQSCIVVQDAQLKDVIARVTPPPALVVTDSQAFEQVAEYTPASIPLTSFSILFARQKGDFKSLVEGTQALANLKPGSKVLIAESCTHHPIGEDIGTVKIPNWLRQYVGGEVEIKQCQGHDFPLDTLPEFDIVIQCGACMWNRREVISRQMHCRSAGVPMTNYGLAIAFLLGIFDRAIKPLEGKY
ncbi:MAG: [FeFe] hydrogenase H-cluster maturation GTPase HydF [Planctomycetaceae bacterium]|jgi:[FeFe] hydrogenase H-cluster maturation GTPase HydF|nr:[FeFe] hydrogenase H-cluster maturation GTPase HydF [Planctomycetaceae bacterium]